MEKKEIENKIGEILGEASMCWTELPTGIFDSKKASKLVDEIVAIIYRENITKIDINKIRGQWEEIDKNGFKSGGNDTIESIKMVAEKVNEIIDSINNLR